MGSFEGFDVLFISVVVGNGFLRELEELGFLFLDVRVRVRFLGWFWVFCKCFDSLSDVF